MSVWPWGSDQEGLFDYSIDVYVAPLGEKALDVAFRVTNEIRAAGIPAEIRYSGKSLKAQLKTADKLRAKKVVMLGDDELQREEVTVRDMNTKDQTPVKIDSIVDHLRSIFTAEKRQSTQRKDGRKA